MNDANEGGEQSRIPDAYLIEIGRITVEWSLLESVFDLGLMKLAGMSIRDPRAWSLFAHMTFPLKLDVFGSLVTELQPKYPGLAEVRAVAEQIRAAQNGRNTVTHAKWGFEEGNVVIARMTARGQIKTSLRTVTLDELRGIGRQINETTKMLHRFVVTGHENPAY